MKIKNLLEGIDGENEIEEKQEKMISLPNPFDNKIDEWDIIDASSHSLFFKKSETFDETKDYILNLYMGEFNEECNLINKIYNALWEFNAKELTIFVDSCGGNYYELLSFNNILKNRYRQRCITILNVHGCSAGAFLFCLGDVRIIFENSIFMIHSSTSYHGGKLNELEKEYPFRKEHFVKFCENLLVKNKFLSKIEFEKMIKGEDFWFDSAELARRNIATHVCIEGKLIESKVYTNYLKNKIKRNDMLKNGIDWC